MIEVEQQGGMKQSRMSVTGPRDHERPLPPREHNAKLSQRKKGGKTVPGRQNSAEK